MVRLELKAGSVLHMQKLGSRQRDWMPYVHGFLRWSRQNAIPYQAPFVETLFTRNQQKTNIGADFSIECNCWHVAVLLTSINCRRKPADEILDLHAFL